MIGKAWAWLTSWRIAVYRDVPVIYIPSLSDDEEQWTLRHGCVVMSDVEPVVTRAPARKWSRIPSPTLAILEAAIRDHRLKYGPERYDLLRDDPRFSPWIGTQLGERGLRRLNRLVRNDKLRR